MPNIIPCPGCGLGLRFFSSEIGTVQTCPRCSSQFEIAVPAQVEADFRAASERKAAWQAKWGNHDHISDPQPDEDFNGFFDAVRAYAVQNGFPEAARVLEQVRIATVPPTEDCAQALVALHRLSPEQLDRFPPQVRRALVAIRSSLQRAFR